MINEENLTTTGDTARIKEVFASIQGEGPYIGAKQLFIRFCDCNLRCHYCDTDFTGDSEEYTPEGLLEVIKQFDLNTIYSVSLTGGEPLLSVDFLEKFLPILKEHHLKIYLETNATLPDELKRIIDYIDVVAADIKLESATGMVKSFEAHDKFFEVCKGKECFAKIVFDDNITDEEIENCVEIAKKYQILLILQPKMEEEAMSITSVFAVTVLDKFLKKYNKVRLIPQVHKFLSVR
ncbi:7-carboxy-7-deazaguanine synthase QueE [bacterium]|uniref:7-carboxy-7-deazaguanine synthase n=1 Tax=Candidatus Scatenecus faecavium TaxID=2840915 RepID=A0A9D1FX11_9BACT|nr:7-carboxy-7-deazaguanine synthase QueE [bacterium]HIS83503.1 7-carboxy-7-deazaguanine synthase QueE [Candidatus Scatenecus faecavium]